MFPLALLQPPSFLTRAYTSALQTPHPLLPSPYNLEQADTRAAQQPSPARRGSRSSQSQSQQESASAAEPLDFVLCIGDDSSDELMFQALQDALGTSTSHSDLFTCTVGRACLHP